MCCIFDFIKWSIGCIHRTLTFFLGVWMVVMVVYACALAIGSGILYGYDYCLAEFGTLARTDIDLEVHPAVYKPEDFRVRRSGNLARILSQSDESQMQKWTNGISSQNVKMKSLPTLLIYRASRITKLFSTPSIHSTSLDTIRNTKSVEMTNEVTEGDDKVTESVDNRSSKKVEIVKNLHPVRFKPITASHISKWSTVYTDRFENTIRQVYPSTTHATEIEENEKNNINGMVVETKTSSDLDPITSAATTYVTKSPMTNKITRTSITSHTGPLMRLFVPESSHAKRQSTKPARNFFYKYRRNKNNKRKTTRTDPEMKIRVFNQPSYGKYKNLPMRHWNISTISPTTNRKHEDDDHRSFSISESFDLSV